MDDWTEQWSYGANGSRLYCGVARTEEGYAVDLFYGDTCVDSFPQGTETDAVRVAEGLKRQYSSITPSVDLETRV